ncbi:FG-GAP-like repeat-containing protein [Aliikangiella coralliicola]|uniref:VCBS repeat-containing protein n=1 Tax=Aliikangiella coralliicola TaxID=2592383 RepID=A0A545UJD7_9GAMM|nr:FG-GAP-like repeat-containing protein [Aliikangiella coralliicola]TQV89582.1 hypothetical protein FLL46_01480 [Aliikangiella coralliicola]
MRTKHLLCLTTLLLSCNAYSENSVTIPHKHQIDLNSETLFNSRISSKAMTMSSEFFEEPGVNVLNTFTGEQPTDGFGWVAENLGDINNDGVNDFIVTAPFFATNVPFPAGKFYVYSGLDGSVLNSVTSPGIPLWGYSAKDAGDVNGDGVGDYVIGSFSSVTVFSGATHGILQQWFKAGEFFGSSVTGIGDINNDGFDDIIVGAKYASKRANTSGSVYAYSGKDGSLLWRRNGRREGDELGTATGRIADINYDGLPDVVVGARGAGKNEEGRAYVLSGRNGRIIHRLKPVGEPGLVTDGAGVTAGTFGQFHAFGVGDVNGDHVADIYVGDYNASQDGVAGTGRGFLYSGKNGKRLHIFTAENPGDGFGPARGAGDVNGDGHNDLFIAAYTYTGGTNAGKGYVYSGADNSLLRTMTGTVSGQFLGVDALTLGDLNGDGLTDYLLTGSGVIHIVSGAEE